MSKRSLAARKGWETRRAKRQRKTLEYQRRSLAAKKGWETRRLTWARDDALGPIGMANHGRIREQWVVLRSWIRSGDERWKKFEREMRKAGFSPTEIRNVWFSPKAKMKGGVGAVWRATGHKEVTR